MTRELGMEKLWKSRTKVSVKTPYYAESVALIANIRKMLAVKLKSYPSDLDRYLWKMDLLSIESLLDLWQKGLTGTEIEYCICISLGVRIEQIMLCFNIMNQTYRKNRSKIGKTLELAKNDNLDIYLIDFMIFRIE